MHQNFYNYHAHTQSRNIFIIILIISITIGILFSYQNFSKVVFHLQMTVKNINNFESNKILNKTKESNNFKVNKSTKSKKTKNNIQPFPIDLVYTWVDSNDKEWFESYEKQMKRNHLNIKQNSFKSRYFSFEELRYSLRTVEKFLLPTINKIYIVTANQKPKWINDDLSIIQFVSHSEIFPNFCSYNKSKEKKIEKKHHEKCLPTFNSNAIDFSLINIPNLSEHFIYCNDDMYFGNYVNWTDFFDEFGRPKFISKNKDWKHIRTDFNSFKRMNLNNEQGGKQFTAMVANTIVTFMDKFGIKNPIDAEFSHIPFPMTKSLFNEVINAFQNKIDKTIQSRFRHSSDLQMETLLIQYGLYKEKAVKVNRSSKNCRFFVADNQVSFYNLVPYVNKKPKMFCINADLNYYIKKIQGFLDNLVGEKSIFEKTGLDEPVSFEDKNFWFLNETKNIYKSFKKLTQKK